MFNMFLQLTIGGLLLGGIYALIAIGLTLIFGVLDIVNFAHGSFLMLAMYLTFWLFHLFGIDPYFSILLVIPVAYLFGLLVMKVVIRPVLGKPHMTQIFATIGLEIVLVNAALLLWTADYRQIFVARGITSFSFMGLIIGFPRLVTFVIALVMMLTLFLYLKKTMAGRAIQAVSQNAQAAQLIGINTEQVFSMAFGLGTICVGIAGALLAPLYATYPTAGNSFALIAFVIVVLGGMGNMAGAFLGGLIIGLVESYSGFYIAPALKELVYFLIFIVILILKPTGLMGKKG